MEMYDIENEQSQLCKLLQFITVPFVPETSSEEDPLAGVNQYTDAIYLLYTYIRKYIGTSTTVYIQYTLPTLIYLCFDLGRQIFKREELKDTSMKIKSKKVMGFIHESITALNHYYPVVALKLWIQGAKVADEFGYDEITYEFASRAFLAYEEHITDSKQQYSTLILFIGTLYTYTHIDAENYDRLYTQLIKYTTKLIRNEDQCRLLCMCSKLFWQDEQVRAVHDAEGKFPQKVLQCLHKALKVAKSCMSQQTLMYTEILNHYVYFYEKKCSSINPVDIKNLMILVEDQISRLDDSEASAEVKTYYNNTVSHIKHKQSSEERDR